MRDLSPTALQSMLAQETDQVYLECITITHPDIASPVRLVNNNEDIPRTAGTFTAWPFQMQLPNDDDAQTPQLTLTLDAVDQTVSQAIQALSYPMPKCQYEVVLASSVNTVEIGPISLDVIQIQIDKSVVKLTLGYEEDLLNEPFPGDLCTPTNAPGLFA